ncbi:DUF1266 domain-containing protein [Providencia sneebia]|uniref:DUF1266 domain-containing protein n=1 Tax=Providencia sneebia DSM 19967 TaxID=1141660 RepID=K8WXS5_9GAMM|nr:DUF1266 domain-containing protein [Providencia sneebia]EKT61015.1 hypothetical protein OO7_02971 [Providencia sneebia DSM 19967]
MSGIGLVVGIIILVAYYAIKRNKSEISKNKSMFEIDPQIDYTSDSIPPSDIEIIEAPTLKPEEWGLFLNLPYSCFNEHAYNDYNQGPYDGGLSQAWGVSNRYDLINQLYWLITSGHTNDYYLLRDRVLYANEAERYSIIQEIKDSDDSEQNKEEQLWRVEMISKNINDICNTKFIAWDFARFSKLCLDGCRAGYITKQEAQDWSLMSASMVKRIYTGWGDFWDNFLKTRWFWASCDSNWADSQENFADKIEEILADHRFPISQETWDMSLPELNLESFTRAVAGLGFTDEDGMPIPLPQLETFIAHRLVPKQLDS